MNLETRKQIVFKVILVSGVACIGWLYLVKPAILEVDNQNQTVKAHQELIVEYEQRIGTYDSQESIDVQVKLQNLLDKMTSDLPAGSSGTSLHNLINEAAGKNGVSVSKIESLNTTQLDQEIEGTTSSVEGVQNVVRVEIEGEYGSVITFMHDVVSGPEQVSFMSFRFLAIGEESVRMNAEINSVMLTSIPSGSLALED
ncbi:MAG: hypothetical protein JKY43_11235 [Phycisphaerales bacterium]|nr:hypothetical protein [Phycisphaerales bacterium]